MAEDGERRQGAIKSPQDLAASLFLLGIAVLALWLGRDLSTGTLRQMGPGMLPKALAVLLAGLAVVLLIDAFKEAGEELAAWSPRAIIFVLGAFCAFGFAVRPLGLSVAGPLAVIIAGFASNETKFVETLIFGLVMTAFCVGLFKFALGLPIPLAPWLIGY
ncbi:MAG TPA: tripartite tricarboxylate transporter TctB family protein [Beijerinckiaceae bacterium]|nr:tripartite tricarboxylate transporter TctB family protein [Beijerinckiaceae bacterium]